MALYNKNDVSVLEYDRESTVKFSEDFLKVFVSPPKSMIYFFNTLSKKDEAVVESYLWRLTFTPSDFASRYELLDKSDSSLERLDDLKVKTFKDEIRYQYNQINPTFLFGTVKSDILDVDGITLSVIERKISEFLDSKSSEDVERSIALISSPYDNCVYGGIKSLSFTNKETLYIKENVDVKALANLIRARYNKKLGIEMSEVVETKKEENILDEDVEKKEIVNQTTDTTTIYDKDSSEEKTSLLQEIVDVEKEDEFTAISEKQTSDIQENKEQIEKKEEVLVGEESMKKSDNLVSVLNICKQVTNLSNDLEGLNISPEKLIAGKDKVNEFFSSLDQVSAMLNGTNN